MDQVEAIRAILKGEKLVPAGNHFTITGSFLHPNNSSEPLSCLE